MWFWVLRHLVAVAVSGVWPVAGRIALALDLPSLNVDVAHGATFFAGRGVALDLQAPELSQGRPFYTARHRLSALTEQFIATTGRCIGKFACGGPW